MLWLRMFLLLLASATWATAQSRWALLDYHNDGGKNLYVYAVGYYSDGSNSHIAYYGRYSSGEDFVRLSTDGGDTWRSIKNDTSVSDPIGGTTTYTRKVNAIEIPAPGIIVMAGDSGTVWRTEDYGENWETLRFGHLWGPFPQFQMVDPEFGIALQLDTLWRTHDGGKTWGGTPFDTSQMGGFLPLQARAFSRDRWTIVGVASRTGYPLKFLTTRNGGTTWDSTYDYSGKIQDRAWSFLDSNNIWYAGSIDTIDWRAPHPDIIRRSWNGGRSWEQLFDAFRGSERGPVDIEFRDTLNGFLTRFEEVDRTTDGGRTWMPASGGLIYDDEFGNRETLLGLTWVTNDMLIAYSNAGRIWRWVEPSSVGEEEQAVELKRARRDADGMLVLENWPKHPVNEVAITDVLGRTSYPEGDLTTGRFDCARYPAGLYFVVVRSGDEQFRVRVVFR